MALLLFEVTVAISLNQALQSTQASLRRFFFSVASAATRANSQSSLARAGIRSVQTEFIRGNKTIKYWDGKADRLLLDAPCSGLGVLRRHPDSKWKLSPDAIEEVRETQADILHRYCRMLKPGGVMVYATCSLMPGENEQQVSAFLEEHSDFLLEAEDHSWPSEGRDGFYMARLRRDS
jgi:16S rRNA (cytosine967-C5)-methyltransferase